MPLLAHTPTIIELPVADRVAGDTLIRQKARFVSLLHTQSPAGECRAVITVLVSLYAADGPGFGPALQGLGFQNYTVELVAANDTLVDAETGQILAMHQGQDAETWQALCNGYTRPVMLQGDWFEAIRETQPVLIGEMIRQHIQQADAMGRFNR